MNSSGVLLRVRLCEVEGGVCGVIANRYIVSFGGVKNGKLDCSDSYTIL